MSSEGGQGGWRGVLAGTTFRSLKHRNYRLYFIGQFVSLTGTWIETTALMWLAFALTHQARWPAFVMAAHLFPACVFGPLGGWIADHFPKRRLVFITQFCFLGVSLTLTVLVFAGWVTVWHLFVLALAKGLVMAIDLPARLAFVPDLIPRTDLINAVALNSVLFNSARLVGPALAGVVMLLFRVDSLSGPGACFLLNTVSYIAVLTALQRMRFDVVTTDAPPRQRVTFAALVGGFVVIGKQRRLAGLIALTGAVAMCGWPLLSLLPAFAERILGMAEGAYSSMLSAVGAGALLAALTVATFGTAARQRWFLWAGVGIIGASLATLSLVRNPTTATALCVPFGFGMILFFPTGQSMVQMRAQDAERGRVMGVWAMVTSAAVPLGNVILGPLADLWGVAFVIRGQGWAAGVIWVILTIFLIRMALRNRSTPLPD